jgi:hypothetical protein
MTAVVALALVVAGTLVSLPSPADAQSVTPGDWSIVDRQPAGAALVVEMVGGEEILGALARTGDVDLVLVLATGAERAMPKSAVVEVRTGRRVRDSLKNGMAYGGLAGAAAMSVLVLTLFSLCDGTCDAPSFGSVFFPAVAMGVGGGVAAGAGVDAAFTRPLVLYRAIR